MEKRMISRPMSQSEGFDHIQAYLRSGLRPSEYYKSHNLSEWQFYQWRKRYLQQHPEVVPPVCANNKKFHPITITSGNNPSVVGSGLELHYPNGVKLVIGKDHPLDIEQLLVLIKQGV
jgi:hypothetical protein